MQKQRVVAWLSQHNFPHGIVSFCDGLVHDPLRHKANFLKSLINDVRVPNSVWLMLFHIKSLKFLNLFQLGPHENLCGLRLHQGHLCVLLHWAAPVTHLHRWEAHKETAEPMSGNKSWLDFLHFTPFSVSTFGSLKLYHSKISLASFNSGVQTSAYSLFLFVYMCSNQEKEID